MNNTAPNTGEQPQVKTSMKDKNGKEIEQGMHVIMPEPNSNDMWNFGGFSAYVEEFKDGYLVVTDGDGDSFCVEPNRVKIDNE